MLDTRRGSLGLAVVLMWVLLTAPVAQGGEPSPDQDPSTSSSTPCYWSDGLPDCGYSVWGSVWISGFVTDPLGQPVVSATVYGGVEPKETDAFGYYATEVSYRTDNPVVTLRAEKPRFDPQSKTVNALNASLDGVDFKLFYRLGAAVSPRYFNNSPQKTLTFDIATGVGPSVGMAFVQLPVGGAIGANYVSEGGDGLSHWQAQWQVPSSTPDGHYSYKACAVTAGSSGNCDSVSSGTRLTQIATGMYTVDGTPPVIAVVSPRPNHNTINTRPTMAASLSDATSGVSWSSTKIYLDGVQVASGTSSYTPPSALPLGVHTVTATTTDLAGNTSFATWDFAVVELIADEATVEVTPKTVLVNPPGNNSVTNRPSTVSVNGIATTLGAFDLDLSASPLWAGTGTVSRQATHASLFATFSNEFGQEVTRAAPVANTNYSYSVAVAEPQSEPIGTNLPPQASSFNLVIAVPPASEFIVTDQSTVTVWALDEIVPTGSVSALNYDPIPDVYACADEGCTVYGLISCKVEGNIASAGYSCNGTNPRVILAHQTGTGPTQGTQQSSLFSRVTSTSSTSDKFPYPNPAEGLSSYLQDGFRLDSCGNPDNWMCLNALDHTRTGFKIPTYFSTGELMSAAGHHYLFSVGPPQQDPSYLLSWQASDASVGSTACRNGDIIEFGHAIEAGEGWSLSDQRAASDWPGGTSLEPLQEIGPIGRDDAQGVIYRLGAVMIDDYNPSGNELNVGPVLSSGQLQGDYLPSEGTFASTGTATDAIVPIEAPGRALRNMWAPYEGVRSQPAEIMTAVELVPDDPSQFAPTMHLYFKFLITETC